jgi:hypothetical protein
MSLNDMQALNKVRSADKALVSAPTINGRFRQNEIEGKSAKGGKKHFLSLRTYHIAIVDS